MSYMFNIEKRDLMILQSFKRLKKGEKYIIISITTGENCLIGEKAKKKSPANL